MNPIRRRRLGSGKSYPMLGAAFAGGSSQFLSIADNAALSMGAGVHPTFAFWVSPAASGATQDLLVKGSGTTATREYMIRLDTTLHVAFLGSDGATAVSATMGTALTLNAWSFVVCQYDGATLGVSVNASAFTTAVFTTDLQDSTQPFRLGLSGGGVEPFTGTLDAVGVWKRVLTANEISQLYKGGVGMAYQDLSGALFTNLVAFYDLDDAGGSGATWVDKAGGNHLIAGTTTAAPTSAPGKR